MRNILFQLSSEDVDFVYALKPILSGRANVTLNSVSPTAVTEVIMRAKEKGATCIATSSEKLLQLLEPNAAKKPTLDDYAGSIINKFGMDFLVVPPVKQLYTVTYGKHLYERYFNKLLRPEDWLPFPKFSWQLFDPKDTDDLLDLFFSANLISIDIETGPEEERIITCIGFTAIHIDPSSKQYRATTVVVPFDSEYNLAFIRTICGSPVAKAFQNGKYDNSYLLRYRTPVANWAFDTINMFHSWYSELPKDLAFITLYLMRDWKFWKNESKTGNIMDYYQYNAKDCFTTAIDVMALLNEMPAFAIRNFLQEFPLVYPCLLAEMTGIKCDTLALKEMKKQMEESAKEAREKLGVMVGNKNFNPGSPKQTAQLFAILGSEDIKSTDVKGRDKVASRHPLNKRIMGDIETYRKDAKLVSTYLDEEKLWHDRIFFAINPHGTDTGRMASKESHFWCGFQIQNIPRDRNDIQIKSMFVADEGFYFGEADGEQAEARDTAYISGDTKLIETVEDKTRDYHSINASAFFGVPYEEITKSYYDTETEEWVHETLNKALRDLSKRTNHGANYNMGAGVMLDTMGIEKVIKAKRLLGLPSNMPLKDVCQFLLNTFAETYPGVKRDYYGKVIDDVTSTHMLVGPTGWTRYCFGDPSKNKLHLNSYVAHCPQSNNAMRLNMSYMRVFYEVALPNIGNFKLGPQIHDSILFQYRKGFEELAWQVKKCMEIEMKVKDPHGITRTLLVPAALKGGAERWSDIKPLKHKKINADAAD